MLPTVTQPTIRGLTCKTRLEDRRNLNGTVVGDLGVLGSWFLVLGSWFLVLGSWFWVLGSWFWVLGSGFWVLGSWFWVHAKTLSREGGRADWERRGGTTD